MTDLEQALTRKIIGLKTQIRRLKAELIGKPKPKPSFKTPSLVWDSYRDAVRTHSVSAQPTGAVRSQVGQTAQVPLPIPQGWVGSGQVTISAQQQRQSNLYQEWLNAPAPSPISPRLSHAMPFPRYRASWRTNADGIDEFTYTREEE